MGGSLLKYSGLCVILLMTVNISRTSLICSYSDQTNRIQIAGYTPGYTCSLSINPKDSIWEKIEGSHEGTKDDSKVKFIKRKFDLRKNPKTSFPDSLKVLKSAICKKFKNLQGIHLDRTGIQNIEPDAFKDCQQLTSLGLGSNQFKRLNEHWLTTNTKLKNLWLPGNKLKSIPLKFLSTQSELEVLDLSKNELSNLPQDLFATTSKLKELNLKHNKIRAFQPNWFKTLHSLEDLDMSYNNISQLQYETFSINNKLKRLAISNKISTTTRMSLSKQFFDRLTSLTFLDLSSNRIFHLPDHVFDGLTNLKYLDVSSNSLTDVHFMSFGLKKHLKVVNLDFNHITAIDEEFIKKTSVSELMMAECACSEDWTRDEMDAKLRDCFKTYEEKYPAARALSTATDETCGKRQTIIISTIIEGQHVTRGEYPWVVAIKHNTTRLICGGTLISRKSVVTAAHCIKQKYTHEKFLASELTVIAGAYDANISNEEGTQSVAVRTVWMHPEWDTKSDVYDADIAVLELDRAVELNKYVMLICLIDPTTVIAGIKTGIIAGYGIDENNKYGLQMSMTSPIVNHNKCLEIEPEFSSMLGPRSFCGNYRNGTGSCSGDSGSGLFVVHDNTFYLRGIVSASASVPFTTCDVQRHSILADVLKFYEWVKNVKALIHITTDEERAKYEDQINKF